MVTGLVIWICQFYQKDLQAGSTVEVQMTETAVSNMLNTNESSEALPVQFCVRLSSLLSKTIFHTNLAEVEKYWHLSTGHPSSRLPDQCTVYSRRNSR